MQLCPAAQTAPHAPQFVALVCTFTHAPPQSTSGAVHVTPVVEKVPLHQPATSSPVERNWDPPSWWKNHRPADGSAEMPHMSPRLLKVAAVDTARVETRTSEMVDGLET